MNLNDKSLKLIKKFGPPLLLLLLIFLFFPRLALMSDLPAAKDVVTFSYPYQCEYWRSLHQWSFPLWSRQANFPLFAESQGGFAHPLSLLLFTAFAPNVASNLMLLIHLYVALLFTYLFLRLLGKSRWAALLGAVVFGLSGFLLARMGIYTVITNGAYLPVLLFFVQKYHSERRLKYLLFYTFAGALAILCGQFQIAVYSLILSGIYLVYLEIKKPWAAIPLLAGMAALVIGLSAVQTLPTYELLEQSQRGAGTAGDYSLWPPQLIQLLLPDLFGRAPHPVFLDIGQAQTDTYWGRSSFVESAFYVGIIPLVLAIGAIARWKKPFWIIVLGVSLLFALGSYTPLFHLYKHIPLLSLFRAPSRFLFMATAALAVLSAAGLDIFIESKKKVFSISAAVCLVAALVIIGVVRFGVPLAEKKLYDIAEEKAEKWSDANEGNYDTSIEYYRGRAEMFIERAKDAANPLKPGNLFVLVMLFAAGALFFLGFRREKLR
ncbi:MAG: YfhO family protein, partial [bacterium]|nr:YfhO family protein [bacterium]